MGKLRSSLQTIGTMLREKRIVLSTRQKKYLEFCEVTDISEEVEEIISRVLDTQHLIADN